MFTIFGVSWVLPCLVRGTLDGWKRLVCQKKPQELVAKSPYLSILDNLEGEKQGYF